MTTIFEIFAPELWLKIFGYVLTDLESFDKICSISIQSRMIAQSLPRKNIRPIIIKESRNLNLSGLKNMQVFAVMIGGGGGGGFSRGGGGGGGAAGWITSWKFRIPRDGSVDCVIGRGGVGQIEKINENRVNQHIAKNAESGQFTQIIYGENCIEAAGGQAAHCDLPGRGEDDGQPGSSFWRGNGGQGVLLDSFGGKTIIQPERGYGAGGLGGGFSADNGVAIISAYQLPKVRKSEI